MKDWSERDDVSPYLLKPLRSYEQAVQDTRQHDALVEQARGRNKRGQLIPFPRWRLRKPIRPAVARQNLRHPA